MRYAQNLWWRIGRRGAFLLFLATLDILYAGSLAHPPKEAARSSTVTFVDGVAPLWAWAALWAAVGVVCAVGAFARRDRWAFAAAMTLKVLWGTTFLLGWALLHLDRGWVSAAIFLPFAAVVLLIATWPEPARPAPASPVDVPPTGEAP